MNIRKTTSLRMPVMSSPWLFALLTVIYCLLYEWVGIFELEGVRTWVNFLKVILPCFLCLWLPSLEPPRSEYFRRYALFFILFMGWGLVPSLLSGVASETVMQWLKHIPRLFFFLVVGTVLLKRDFGNSVIKLLTIIGALIVFQYIILEIASRLWLLKGIELPSARGGLYFGPYGILGNGTAQFSCFYPIPRFRLQGFWLEPSNSSAFLFSVYFLSRRLFAATGEVVWKAAGIICLAGGIFVFSNAGYLALGCALLIGQAIAFFVKKERGFILYVKVMLSILLVLASVGGRYVAIRYFPSNTYLLALTGVRGKLLNTLSEENKKKLLYTLAEENKKEEIWGRVQYNITWDNELFKESLDGRLELMHGNLQDMWRKPIIGLGFRIDGKYNVSASAPVKWFTYTGIIGLILLLLREAQVVLAAGRVLESPIRLAALQGWAIILIQHTGYGSWMTPMYLLAVVLFIDSIFHEYSSAAEPVTEKELKSAAL